MVRAVQERNGRSATPTQGEGALTFTPRVDVLGTPEELVLVLDLPGVKPEDLDVRCERGELQVQGRCPPPARPGRPLVAEYATGDFHRAFTIPEDVDADKITAELKHGVLTLRLPRAESARPRRIPVQGE